LYYFGEGSDWVGGRPAKFCHETSHVYRLRYRVGARLILGWGSPEEVGHRAPSSKSVSVHSFSSADDPVVLCIVLVYQSVCSSQLELKALCNSLKFKLLFCDTKN